MYVDVEVESVVVVLLNVEDEKRGFKLLTLITLSDVKVEDGASKKPVSLVLGVLNDDVTEDNSVSISVLLVGSEDGEVDIPSEDVKLPVRLDWIVSVVLLKPEESEDDALISGANPRNMAEDDEIVGITPNKDCEVDELISLAPEADERSDEVFVADICTEEPVEVHWSVLDCSDDMR